jgi:hypothetical protein
MGLRKHGQLVNDTIIETTAIKPKKRYNPNRDPNFNPNSTEFQNRFLDEE